MLSELNGVLRHYIRAKMTLVGLSFTYVSLSLFVLRYPHALALGILAGVLEFIPIAGWITAATTIIIFGIVTHSHWIWMAALLAIWRILIDYWIAPRVLGRELEMHPILAIFTLMGGRCRWRIRRRLSRFTDRSNYSSHLAEAWQFARTRKACVAGRGHCSGRVLRRAEKNARNYQGRYSQQFLI